MIIIIVVWVGIGWHLNLVKGENLDLLWMVLLLIHLNLMFSAADFADSSAGVMLSAGAQVATETASQQLDDALNEDADKDKEI